MSQIIVVGSDLTELVRHAYKNYVERDLEFPTELKNALKAHERVPLMIDNLARELREVEKHAYKLKGIQPTKQELVSIVEDFTRVFLQNLVRQADEKRMSDAAKAAIKQNEADAKQAMQMIEESQINDTTETNKEGYETSTQTYQI